MGCHSPGRECTSLASSRCIFFWGDFGWRGGILVASLVEQFFLKRLIEDDVNRLKPYVKNASLIASLLFSSNPCVHVPKGLNDIHDLDLFQLVHARPVLVWSQLAGFFAKGLYYAAMAGTIATSEHWAFVGSHSEAAAHHAGLLVEGWSNKHLLFHGVFFWWVLPWRTYRQGIRRHLTKVPGRCCSSCSKKSRTVVLEVESIELCLTVLGNQKLSIHSISTLPCDLTKQPKDTKSIASTCSLTGALFHHLLDRCGCQSKIPQLHGR